ncbi:hypothetical protein Purlil1_7176 [Purpureocillium lilacinum]|uniref:Uncharacterized protein n=1 Tax=Purpureocillium lilacinum TaxID=33203 RepID=A0ABR0BXC0_PURLI|nr:hypothetical protein Purlil1_7176 [Purpureocillium lilacinum]
MGDMDAPVLHGAYTGGRCAAASSKVPKEPCLALPCLAPRPPPPPPPRTDWQGASSPSGRVFPNGDPIFSTPSPTRPQGTHTETKDKSVRKKRPAGRGWWYRALARLFDDLPEREEPGSGPRPALAVAAPDFLLFLPHARPAADAGATPLPPDVAPRRKAKREKAGEHSRVWTCAHPRFLGRPAWEVHMHAMQVPADTPNTPDPLPVGRAVGGGHVLPPSASFDDRLEPHGVRVAGQVRTYTSRSRDAKLQPRRVATTPAPIRQETGTNAGRLVGPLLIPAGRIAACYLAADERASIRRFVCIVVDYFFFELRQTHRHPWFILLLPGAGQAQLNGLGHELSPSHCGLRPSLHPSSASRPEPPEGGRYQHNANRAFAPPMQYTREPVASTALHSPFAGLGATNYAHAPGFRPRSALDPLRHALTSKREIRVYAAARMWAGSVFGEALVSRQDIRIVQLALVAVPVMSSQSVPHDHDSCTVPPVR